MTKTDLLSKIIHLFKQSPRIAILISGQGSNAQVILSNAKRYSNLHFITICTDKRNSNASMLSSQYGLDYFCLESKIESEQVRETYFKQLADYLEKQKIDTLIYAGFMKISPAFFVNQFPGINVHPADLTIMDEANKPKYTGMHAIHHAVKDGLPYLASTAHVVDSEVDCGSPIMVSKHLSLEGRYTHDYQLLHEQLKITCEHPLYPRLLELLSQGRLMADDMPYRWSSLDQAMKINNGSYFSTKLLNAQQATTPLDLAYLAQDYSSEVGFDFSSIDEVMQKVREEFSELNQAFQNKENNFNHFVEEIGDCFFSLVNLCRFINIHPEIVVKRNVIKYLNRCQHIEHTLIEKNSDWSNLSANDIIQLWKQAKQHANK